MGTGHETTAHSLSWTTYELAKHFDMQKIQEAAGINLGCRNGPQRVESSPNRFVFERDALPTYR